jgi:hypothetical protein
MTDDRQGPVRESRSLRSAANARRALALFRAMSADYLLREQFVTDPAQIWSEYVHGSSLPPQRASVVNQLVYAVMSNPGLVRWLADYAIRRTERPSREQFLLDFGRGAVENEGRHVLYALARAVSENEAVLPIDESILDLLFGSRVVEGPVGETERPATRGATEGTFGGTQGTFGGTAGTLGATEGTFGGTEGTLGGTAGTLGGTQGTFGGTEGTFGGTEGTFGGTAGTLGATEGTFGGTEGTLGGTAATLGGTQGTFGGTEGTFGGTAGTAMTHGTFGHGTGLVTEMSTGTGGTQMSTGTGGTQMSTGAPTPTPPTPSPTPTPPTPTPTPTPPTPTPTPPTPTPTPPTPTPTPPTPTPPTPPDPTPRPPIGPMPFDPPIFPPIIFPPITSIHPGTNTWADRMLRQPEIRVTLEALVQYSSQLRVSGALDSTGERQ